jgi:hypothetical protein
VIKMLIHLFFILPFLVLSFIMAFPVSACFNSSIASP